MITKNAEIFKKAPKWLYKTAAQLYIDRKFPRHLFVETTAACNLKCEYCPRDRISEHMDFGLFKMVIDEASQYGARSFSLHLFGEPLLYPRILDAINFIKQKNRRHTVLLTTNGTLLNRYANDLVKLKVDKIIWSWRPEAKFDFRTIGRLKGYKNFTVRLIKETVPKEEFERWSKWPNVEVRSLHNYGGNIDLLKYGANSTDGKRYPCYHLWLAPAVAWNGNHLICCSDPHQKEVIGKFPEMSIAQAWQEMEKNRQWHLKGEYGGICKDCDVWKSYPNLFFSWQSTT